MKVTPQAPILFISGTQKPEKELNYYEYLGQQVVRKYAHPPEPYNTSFVTARDYNDICLAAWRSLDNSLFRPWVDLTDNWNRQITWKLKCLNPWLTFYKCNFYRLLNGQAITTTPPALMPFKAPINISCAAIPGAPGELLINYTVANLPTTGFRLVIWMTKAWPGYRHAYRVCERKLINGFNPDSIFDIPIKNGLNQIRIPTPIYSTAASDYFYIESQLLSPDYFPHLVNVWPVQAQEENKLLSIGSIWENFPVPFSGGSPPDYCQYWYRNIHSEYVESSHNEEMAIIPLPYKPDSIITSIRLLWQGSAPPGGLLTCGIVKEELGAGFEHYDFIGSQINVAAVSPYEITLTEQAQANIQIDDTHLYGLKIYTNSSGRLFRVYAISVKTSQRSY